MYIPSLLSALLATTLVHAIPLEEQRKSHLVKRSTLVCNAHDVTLLKDDIKTPVQFCESWLAEAKHTTTPVKGLSLQSASAACSCVTSSAKSVAVAAAKKTTTTKHTTTTKKATTTTKHTTTTKKAATTTVKKATTSTKKTTTSTKKTTTSTKKTTTTTKKPTTTTKKTTTSTKKTTTSTKPTTTTKPTTSTKKSTTTSKTTTKVPVTTTKVTTKSTTTSTMVPTTTKSSSHTSSTTTSVKTSAAKSSSSSSSKASSKVITSSSAIKLSTTAAAAAVATHVAAKDLVTNGDFANGFNNWTMQPLDAESSSIINQTRAVIIFPANNDALFSMNQNLSATYVASNYTLSLDLYPNYPSGLPTDASISISAFNVVETEDGSSIVGSYEWFDITLTSANGSAVHVNVTLALEPSDDVTQFQSLYFQITTPSNSEKVTLGIDNVAMDVVASAASSTTSSSQVSSAVSTSHSSSATFHASNATSSATHQTSSVASSTSASSTPVYTGNIIKNGDFSTGTFGNWSTASTEDTTAYASIYGNSSANYRALITMPSGGASGEFLQASSLAIPAAANYTLTADLYPNYPSGLAAGDIVEVTFEHAYGQSLTYIGELTLDSTYGAGPYSVSYTFMASPDATGYTNTFAILFQQPKASGDTVTVGLDNVVVKLTEYAGVSSSSSSTVSSSTKVSSSTASTASATSTST